MERQPSLNIHTPRVYESESTTPHSHSSEYDSDEDTSSKTPEVYPEPPPPPPRNWWNPVVLYPTVTNLIPLLMILYAIGISLVLYTRTREHYLSTMAFLGYTILFEWYIGNVFLYLTFEPTLSPLSKKHEQINHTIADSIVTLYESVWIILLPTPESFVNGYISMGSIIALLFMDQMLPKHSNTDWRTSWYVASACRRAFVVGYLMTESLPMF